MFIAAVAATFVLYSHMLLNKSMNITKKKAEQT